MPTFYDSQGQSYDLTSQIGRGGEGTVFACPHDLNLVAKIYHEPIDAEKAEKLQWMAANKNELLLKVAAWIVDTLHDAPDGRIVGFLMPNVKAKEIHELYSLKSRRVHFPEATWQFLIHAATNVARAFYSLHKNGHIMGDVNHGNCVVLRDGTVKLIDCDSYSISKGDFRYPCEVGVATHLAPELQGMDLGEVERIPAHDNFGLAVIVFQLLFLGRHPFSGNYLGAEDKSLEDCIRERRFAYGEDAHLWKVKQPPGTLSLSAVSPRLATMFERAFLTDERPEPREWIEALEDLSDSLKQCGLHIGHYYFQELHACPWCALESQTGLMLFPFVSGVRAAGQENFNIFTIENLVSSLAIPQNLPMKPPKTNILPPPSPEAENARRENLSRFITLAVLQFCIVIFLTAIAGPGVGFFIGALLMAGFIVTLNNSGKNSKVDLEIRLESARRDWNQLENEWSAADTVPRFNNDVALIRQKITEHHQLQQQSREKVKQLHDGVFNHKLGVYLSSFKIDDANIAGLDPINLNLVKSRGIRTAADVDPNHLKSMPPFMTNETREKIVDWRENLERGFVYDPDAEVPEGKQLSLTEGFTEKRGKIEREIENLLVSLRSGSTLVNQRQQHLLARAETVARQLVQSESDMAAAGSITPPIVVLILITTLIPMFGNAFSSSKPSKYNSSAYNSEPRLEVKKAPSNYAYNSNLANNAPVNVYGYTVPDYLTDDQIEELTESERQSGAQQLLERAAKFAGEKNYKNAMRRLELALKLDADNVKVLNKLGEVLYEQKKYKDSLEYLNRSLKLAPDNTEAKFAVGDNYLRLNYYEDARRIFSDLNTRNPASFEAQLNLGLAYKGLGQYYSAVTAFRNAARIKGDSPEAHYEYAFSLNKVGSQDDVIREYQTLYQLDSKMAEKLRKELGLKNVPLPEVKFKESSDGVGIGGGQVYQQPAGTGSGSGSGSGN
jgi:DNA-binding helix-hairpin-helix protein with protein kinase domain/Tfp pilus assembly protein PilF